MLTTVAVLKAKDAITSEQLAAPVKNGTNIYGEMPQKNSDHQDKGVQKVGGSSGDRERTRASTKANVYT